MAHAYHEVAAELRRRIIGGTYGPKTPMPSERALEIEFKIHRATARRALAELAHEGLITRNPGRRAYVQSQTPSKETSIGLFAAEPTDAFARSLIANGVSNLLHEGESVYNLVWSNYLPFLVGAPLSEVLEAPFEKLSGLILWPPKIVALDRLRKARRLMPVVLIDLRVPGFEADFVGFRDVEAGYEAAKHLYSVGHRRLAFIGDIVPETAYFRRHGFLQFCAEAGVEPMWDFAHLGPTLAALPDAMQRALPDIPKSEWPTAAVCANDETAARTITFLNQFGLKVPDDLALIGFGGAQPGLLNALGLTTMEQPYEQMGREAAEMVLDRLHGAHRDRPARELRLPMKLHVRRSCGSRR